MKTILIAHNYSETSFSAMSFYFAHHLADSGHKVVFISHKPFFPEKKIIKTEKGEINLFSWSSEKRPIDAEMALLKEELFKVYGKDDEEKRRGTRVAGKRGMPRPGRSTRLPAWTRSTARDRSGGRDASVDGTQRGTMMSWGTTPSSPTATLLTASSPLPSNGAWSAWPGRGTASGHSTSSAIRAILPSRRTCGRPSA